MQNTVRKTAWAVGLPPKQLEHFCADVRRALNLDFYDRFTTTTLATGAMSTIWQETLPSNAVWDIECIIIGRATAGGAGRALYRAEACAYREAAGAATLEGAVAVLVSRESVAGFDYSVGVDGGTDALIQVQDDGVRTMNWDAHVFVRERR